MNFRRLTIYGTHLRRGRTVVSHDILEGEHTIQIRTYIQPFGK